MVKTTTHTMRERLYMVVRNKKVIGQYTLFIRQGFVYVWCFIIDKPHRNNGIGTDILLRLARRYKRVYICPSNENSARLYARLGNKVDKCPKELQKPYREIGKMYLICG